MHNRRLRGGLASKYHRALAHWDARPMARDWPQDRWFQEGGVRGSQPGRHFWGWRTAGEGDGTDASGKDRQVSDLRAVFGEDAVVFRYQNSTMHRLAGRFLVFPRWLPSSRGSKRDDDLMPCSKSEACDAGRVCLAPSTIAFSAFLSGRML